MTISLWGGGTLYAILDLLSDAGLVVKEGSLLGYETLWIAEQGDDDAWTEQTTLIAHAMGAIDGVPYTNSLEAFQANYAAGFSVFEVDFGWSADGEPVCVHDWPHFANYVGADAKSFAVPTLAEFKQMRILEEYTTLSF